ncbi:MAG: Uma2 family endonuclease [Planctomycetes bacterium]|nr:Uma2 family endonuclease [Planctomycetota bacterium]
MDPLDLATLPPSAAQKPRLDYPESDGKPVGETDPHIAAILYLRQALQYVFRRAENTYAAANLLVYYEEGNPDARFAPDAFVVKGVPKHDRRTYKLWEERVPPCAVIEVTSRSSRLEDKGNKKTVCEMLGVREYYLFDPLSEYLKPRFQGHELVGGAYQPMPLLPDGTLRSRELSLVLCPEGPLLRVVDPETGVFVPTLDEAIALERQATARAEAETKRAKAEGQRAESEGQRASRAEAEAARLREEVERLRRGNP